MHILILPSFYPSPAQPIKGSFFREQAEALARYGHKVSVIALRSQKSGKTHIEATEREGITEYYIYYKPIRFHLTFFRIVHAMMGILRKNMHEKRPDIIHVHVYQAAKYARALKKIFRIPYVITEHVSWYDRGMLSPHGEKEAKKAFRDAGSVISVSQSLAKAIQKYCTQEIHVIPNMVSERFLSGALQPADEGKPVRILSVCSLDENKRPDLLLRGAAPILRENPAASLVICGGGPLADVLAEQATALGIASQVALTGVISREEVLRQMQGCTVFALVSRTETFGIVLLEAMACGRPIVMTRTGAWNLLISADTGIALETDTPEAVESALRAVISNSERYDPEMIRERCRETFSEEAVCKLLTAEYERILSQ